MSQSQALRRVTKSNLIIQSLVIAASSSHCPKHEKYRSNCIILIYRKNKNSIGHMKLMWYYVKNLDNYIDCSKGILFKKNDRVFHPKDQKPFGVEF